MNEDGFILRVENLSVEFLSHKGTVRALRGVSFGISKGASFALIGESGSGKSTVAFSVLNYLPSNGRAVAGEILFHGENLLEKCHADLQPLWGNRISMVFQDPIPP